MSPRAKQPAGGRGRDKGYSGKPKPKPAAPATSRRAPVPRVGAPIRGGDVAPRRKTTAGDGLGGDQVEGRQAVRELLYANRRPIVSIAIAEGMDASPILDEIEDLATAKRIKIEYLSRKRHDALARTESSQGVLAIAKPITDVPLDALCQPTKRGRVPFLLVLDGVTDPHNLGSVLRSAECAGVTGIVLPRHRAAHLSPTVTKVAAGAIEYLPMALVAGIPTALQQLRDLGVWSVGLVGEADQPLYDLSLGTQPVALVLGSEGNGLAALTRKRCDVLASIPQHGTLSSLNVAMAGAIACFDVARQRLAD